MWYEDKSSKNMTASVPRRLPGSLANGNGFGEEEKRAVSVQSVKDDLANRLNIELALANSGQKVPVRRYKTRTNSEWLKTFASRLPPEADQRMDYVLVYKKKSEGQESDGQDPDRLRNDDLAQAAREKFLDALDDEGFEVVREEIGNRVYLKLHTPFWRLCKEAEREGLKMPLKDMKIESEDEHITCRCWSSFERKYLQTDEKDDFISGPFKTDRLDVFKDGDNANLFFRSALRSLLTYWILVNIDIARVEDKTKAFLYSEQESDALVKQGLLYMLHKKYYSDAFPVHDEAKKDPGIDDEKIRLVAMYGSRVIIKNPLDMDRVESLDNRQQINDAWLKFYKYQPLWMIRDYFGEKIGLYFAWCGTFIATLWLPMLFGLAVFGYGLFFSASRRIYSEDSWMNTTNKAGSIVEQSIAIVKESFDNKVTPYFAIAISLWGTVFLEFWKRECASLAYEWDVNSFELTEPDRPGYETSTQIYDPFTKEFVKFSPKIKQMLKFGVSAFTLIFMVCLVFIAAAAIIVYRIVMTVDYCINMTPTNCLLATALGSSLLNALAILVLGKVYEVLAWKLTDWENHRTQTQYDDSLILKLFAFQFANSYTSLYYIAFFRGRAFQQGVFGLGPQYKDTCGDEVTTACMSMLSFQVLVLMLTKPLPKLVKDVLWPVLKWLWRTKIKRILQRCYISNNQISSDDPRTFRIPTFLEREYNKPSAGDFTMTEYTEKIIIYGYLMLFAASLPIAPLIAQLTFLIDIRIDAKRLLWLDRRPVAFIAQDIGTWYTILNFLNIVGVVSNACLIAFTSSWGSTYDLTGQLLIVIGFEHIVFGVKFVLAVLIPDVPSSVELSQRREIYITQKVMDTYGDEYKDESGSSSPKRRKRSIPSVPTITEEVEDIRPAIPGSPGSKLSVKKGQNIDDDLHKSSSPELNSRIYFNRLRNESPTAARF